MLLCAIHFPSWLHKTCFCHKMKTRISPLLVDAFIKFHSYKSPKCIFIINLISTKWNLEYEQKWCRWLNKSLSMWVAIKRMYCDCECCVHFPYAFLLKFSLWRKTDLLVKSVGHQTWRSEFNVNWLFQVVFVLYACHKFCLHTHTHKHTHR